MPELLYFDTLCVRCYRCVEVCPNKSTALKPDGSLSMDHERCKKCRVCVEACLSGARVISGKRMSVAEVLEIIKKDSLFYRNSGGGVTASGGEPTSQPEFLTELFRQCQDMGFHTALDTCGYVHWEVLEKILEYVDLVLFDIKHMVPVRHHELTGVDNQLILENAQGIARVGKQMVVRFPLIPGISDSEENVRSVAEFMRKNGISRIDLLPYHKLGVNKYKRLGKVYKLMSLQSYEEDQIRDIVSIFETHGLEVSVA